MKVRFENCEVEIWKVRAGTVLAIGYEGNLQYVTVLGLYNFNEPGSTVKIVVDHNYEAINYYPAELIWLES